MKAIHQTFILLLLLLALTVGVSYLPLNLYYSEAIGLGIAWVKAGLVARIFMKLREEHPSLRFVALAGLVWVLLLVGFISTEYATRDIFGILGK